MSLSIDQLQTIGIRDPRTAINPRIYGILKGAQEVTFVPTSTTNITSSSITYSIKTPPNVFINKLLYQRLPVRIRLNCSAPNAQKLLRPNYDSLRAFPIAQATQSISCSFNGSTASVNLGDVFGAMIRYNTDDELRHGEYSMTPSYLDMSQNYNDLIGTVRNPLSFYGDGGYGDSTGGRAGFPFKIVANETSYAIIDTVLCEQLFCNPWFIGSCENLGSSAFLGVQNLEFQWVYYANAGFRMWSHAEGGAFAPGIIDSCNIAFNNFESLLPPGLSAPFSYSYIQGPQLLMEYLTPQQIEKLPESMLYPYFRVDRFITDNRTEVAALTQFEIVSQNIILNSMPKRIFIFARNNNNTMQNGYYSGGVLQRSACSLTDTFASVEQLVININNKAGVLSSSTKQDLFSISCRNKCNLNWAQWSGEQLYQNGFFDDNKRFGTVGSVVCITPGIDFGVDSSMAAGCQAQINLQITAKFKNCNPTYAMNPAMFIICVSEGVFTIKDGGGYFQIGVLSPLDVINSTENVEAMTYEEYTKGGDFISGVKNFGQRVSSLLRKAWNKVGRKARPYIEDVLPQSKPFLHMAEQYLGDREGQPQGNGMSGGDLLIKGGRMTSKAELKRRLKNRMRK